MQLPVCILAGGLGTRLGSLAADRPKALVPVAGEPFVLHQLRGLAAAGVPRIVLCVGHLGEQVEAEVGAARFGMPIAYAHDGPRALGTAGALRAALPLLGDAFLVLYGDTLLQVDFAAVERSFLESPAPALMTVLRNEDRWDRSNVVVRDGLVAVYDKHATHPGMHWIDYGLGALHRSALDAAGPDEPDLSAVQRALAAQGNLAAHEVFDRFHEIGTPEALAETEAFLTRPPT